MASDKELIASDIEGYLKRYESKELLRFVAVGSVDDGKSTLIGRLLYDTGSVYLDQLESIRKATHMAGTDIDLSLVTDGLAAEREQGITIDVAYRYFNTDKRKFIIADTPGHVQYTRNMVTGASTAHAAIILIDARLGVLEQSRRHAYIASLLGIPHLAVCLNKMDLVDYQEARYRAICGDFSAFIASAKIAFSGVAFFPVSALLGVNCVHRSDRTPWYGGPTVLEYLESVPAQEETWGAALRYPVQYVLRPNLDYRGFAGRIASGVVTKGQAITVLPSGLSTRVRSIDTFSGEVTSAAAPQSVTLRLEDEVDVSRGDMLVDANDVPRTARTFDAHVVWMHDLPLDLGKTYLLKHTTQTTRVNIDRVHFRKDMDTLEERPAASLELNDIGRVTLTAHRTLFLDAYKENRETGSFILVDTISNGTVGAGMVIADARGAGAAPGNGEPAGPLRKSPPEHAWISHGVLVIADSDAQRGELLGRAIEARLRNLGVASVVIRAMDVASTVRAARAVADAGLLAVTLAPASSLGDAAFDRLDRQRLFFVLASGAPSLETQASRAASSLDLARIPEEDKLEAVMGALLERWPT